MDTKEIYEALAELLNAEINKGGKIQQNNPTIWTALHAIDDRLWRAIIEDYLKDNRYMRAWPAAQEILDHLNKYEHIYHPWTITPYEGLVKRQQRPGDHQNKRAMWRWLMATRERYCDLNYIDLPNEDSSIGKLDPRPTDALFDWSGQ